MLTAQNCYKYPSVSGLADICAYSFFPDRKDAVKGIVQLAHGMAEHSKRYFDFAKYLCSGGYAVFISDHLGHGKSVNTKEELGFFGNSDGDRVLVEDLRQLAVKARERFPDAPFFLFGHSMGSFVARAYAAKYGKDIAGAIFCGTSGPNPAAGIGAAIASTDASIKGIMHRSEFINSMAFGSYNKRFKPARTAFDWLSRDEKIVDKYILDPLCGYLFTAAGYRDMFTLLKKVSDKKWYAELPKELPILLITGAEDPVGAYGAGVSKVYNALKASGHEKTEIKVYPKCRHELLNELNKDEVYSDIAAWIGAQCD